jgi:hypothetical protein
LCRFETKTGLLEMKRIIYVLAICLIAGVYSCSHADKGNSGSSDAASIEKAKRDSLKNDSLLQQANDMNAPDTTNTKKDSVNKPKK